MTRKELFCDSNTTGMIDPAEVRVHQLAEFLPFEVITESDV